MRIASHFFDAGELTINWSDGRQSRLAAIWLRDHCQMPASRDPVSGQRLINITDLPRDLSIQAVTLEEESIVIDFAPQEHQSVFTIDWLLQNCYCLNTQYDDRSEISKSLWQAEDFDNGIPEFDYCRYSDDENQRYKALQTISDLGFVILNNVPCRSGQVLDVIRSFGFVRETNYGPFFEVRTEVNANNLAFTNLGLGCHLDNPYRDPVPGLQLLHCLESSTSGGESILQDGFMAASVLRSENPEHFRILSRQWINFRYQNATTNLHSRTAMLEVNDLNQLIKVRFNNRSIDTLILPPAIIAEFYDAYRHFAEILQRESLQISFKLDPGDLMLFDNSRIMHARKAYASGGRRHLQGAYSDLDGLYSALSLLKSAQHKP